MKIAVLSVLALGGSAIALPTVATTGQNANLEAATHTNAKRLEILSQNIGMSIGRIVGMILGGQGPEKYLQPPSSSDGFITGISQKIGGNVGWEVGQVIALGHTV